MVMGGRALCVTTVTFAVGASGQGEVEELMTSCTLIKLEVGEEGLQLR